MITINENSDAFFTAAMFDPSNAPETPSAVTVSLICLQTRKVLRAPTSFGGTLGPTISLSTTAVENAIQARKNTVEKKRLIIVATYGVGGQIEDYFDYQVARVGLQAS